jgi:hypothetical protein
MDIIFYISLPLHIHFNNFIQVSFIFHLAYITQWLLLCSELYTITIKFDNIFITPKGALYSLTLIPIFPQYFLNTRPQTGIHKYILSFYSLSFHFLDGILWHARVFNFDEVLFFFFCCFYFWYNLLKSFP